MQIHGRIWKNLLHGQPFYKLYLMSTLQIIIWHCMHLLGEITNRRIL